MVQVVLVHYNLVDNQYQQKPEYYIILLLINLMLICYVWDQAISVFENLFCTEFDKIIITFTDQTGRPLEIEGKINLT